MSLQRHNGQLRTKKIMAVCMSWDNYEKLLKTVKFLVSNPQTDCEYDTM